MANPEHVEILKQGANVWNVWRMRYPKIKPDLKEADFTEANLNRANLVMVNCTGAIFSGACLKEAVLWGANLSGANLSDADLTKAELLQANLMRAKLSNAVLERADLKEANLWGVDLIGANLEKANLTKAELSKTDIIGTNLRGANLSGAFLGSTTIAGSDLSRSNILNANFLTAVIINSDLSGATISDCIVYGVSAWGLNLEGLKEQKNLRITPEKESAVYVDNLEVAQFVYLLLHNEKIRGVIDTIGEKGVLILGRFTPERKAVLDAIRDKLRELGFVPMMFDFEKPTQRDFTETIKTLAGMSRFIIADITNPKSAPLELQAILPHYIIPLVPILQKGEKPFAMFRDLDQKYRQWVLPLLKYDTAEKLIMGMEKAIIKPAKLLASKLQVIKAQEREARDIDDYL